MDVSVNASSVQTEASRGWHDNEDAGASEAFFFCQSDSDTGINTDRFVPENQRNRERTALIRPRPVNVVRPAASQSRPLQNPSHAASASISQGETTMLRHLRAQARELPIGTDQWCLKPRSGSISSSIVPRGRGSGRTVRLAWTAGVHRSITIFAYTNVDVPVSAHRGTGLDGVHLGASVLPYACKQSDGRLGEV